MAARSSNNTAGQGKDMPDENGRDKVQLSTEQEPLLQQPGQHDPEGSDQPHHTSSGSSNSMSRQQSTHRRNYVASKQANWGPFNGSSRHEKPARAAHDEGFWEDGKAKGSISKGRPWSDPEAQTHAGEPSPETPWYRQWKVRLVHPCATGIVTVLSGQTWLVEFLQPVLEPSRRQHHHQAGLAQESPNGHGRFGVIRCKHHAVVSRYCGDLRNPFAGVIAWTQPATAADHLTVGLSGTLACALLVL